MREKNKNIKVTITMLVSNRINTIRKCMDSIKPILQQVPSELIVVDTGCTDGSIDVAEEYADEIVKFEWCNDFSKARNAGLERASGEWVMSLDDDEWFDDVSEIIDFFQTGEYKRYNRAIYVVRNYADMEGLNWSDSNAGRMVKRLPNTRYTGKVHEWLGPLQEPTKFFNTFVHHYGYAFQTTEEHREHTKRNLPLMEAELKDDPENMRVIPQIVQEYYSLKMTKRVLELCARAMEIYQRNHQYSYGAGYCYNFSLRAYMQAEDWDAAYEWGKKILEEGAPTSMALMGTVREMVTVCQISGNYREGLEYLEKYREMYGILQKKVNRDEIYLDLSKYLKEQELDFAYMNGIALGVLAGDWDAAGKYFSLKDWDASPLILYPDTLDYVMKLWGECSFRQEFADALDEIVRNEPFHKQITGNIQKCSTKDPSAYRRLMYVFAACRDASAYTVRYRLMYYAQYREEEREKIRELVKLLWTKDANPLLWGNGMWPLIRRNQISVVEEIRMTNLAEWFTQVRSWLEMNIGREGDEWDDVYTTACRDNEQEGMHCSFWKLKREEGIMRRKLRKQGTALMTSQWLLKYLNEFYSQMWNFFSHIYREEMFEYDTATVLPPEAAFAVYIRLAVQRKQEGDDMGYLQILPKAAECYPPMKEWCKILLQKEKEEHLSKRTLAEENEFLILAAQMKQKVRELINDGNFDAARQLILQLEKLLPGDRELMALMEMIP